MDISPEISSKQTGKRTAKVRAASVAEPKSSVAPAVSKTKKSAVKAAEPAQAKVKVAKAKVADAPVSKVSKKKATESVTVKDKPAAKSRATRKTTRKATASSVIAHSESELRHMIAEAAYYLAEKRRFAPGGEGDDWLLAEQQIRSQYQHA